MNLVPLEKLTFASFSELKRTLFRVRLGDSALELELAEATPGRTCVPSRAALPAFESFSLLFQGAAATSLQQGTYRFEHDRIGAFDLFIVPVGLEKGVMKYEAVFNRPATSAAVPRSNPTA